MKTRPAPRRRPYHHRNLPAALVDAARQLALERGPSSLSLREVARRAGVSEAAPYHYFSSKRALLDAVGASGFDQLDEVLTLAARHAPADPVEQVAALAAAYVRFALDRPQLFRLMFPPRDDGHPDVAPSARAIRLADRLAEAVRDARGEAGRDDGDPPAAAAAVWSVAHGLACLYLEGPLANSMAPGAIEDLARAAARTLAVSAFDDLGSADPSWAV